MSCDGTDVVGGVPTLLTFETSGVSLRLTSVGGLSENRAPINDSDLSTVGYAKYCPSKRVTLDPVEIGVKFNPATFKDIPIQGAPETITITYPPQPPLANGGTLSGLGFVTNRTGPSLSEDDDSPAVGSMQIQFSGTPTYSAGS